MLLRHSRERRGITLDELAGETKIPRRHLEALEHENLSAVPGGIYLRAEVRAYARAVHLDQSLALTRLERLLDPPTVQAQAHTERHTVEPDPPITVRTRIQPLVLFSAALLTIVLATAVATLWWRVTGSRDDADAPPISAGQGSGLEVVAPAVALDTQSVAPGTTVVTSRAAPDRSRAERSSAVERPPATSATAPVPPVNVPQTAATQRAVPPAESAAAVDEANTSAVQGASTELVIATQPPGARVTVDGISWGTSPVTIRHVSPGSKRIRVSLDGYASVERSITLAAGRRQQIELQLHGR